MTGPNYYRMVLRCSYYCDFRRVRDESEAQIQCDELPTNIAAVGDKRAARGHTPVRCGCALYTSTPTRRGTAFEVAASRGTAPLVRPRFLPMPNNHGDFDKTWARAFIPHGWPNNHGDFDK